MGGKEMKRKIIGILVVTLLIAVTSNQIAMSLNPSDIEKNGITADENCGCNTNLVQPIVLTVGDCGSLDYEPTVPWPGLVSWIQDAMKNNPYWKGFRDCDETGENKWWAHTFDLNLTCNQTFISDVFLGIRIDNNDDNDGMNIGFIDKIGDPWQITGRLNTYWGIGLNDGFVSLDIDFRHDYQLFFDKLKDGTYTHIDILVQDDSPVDCAILTIECCECEFELEIQRGIFFGKTEPQIIVRNIGNTDCDIDYTFTITSLWKDLHFTSPDQGTISPLPSGGSYVIPCKTSETGLSKLEVTATACEGKIIVTDTVKVLVIDVIPLLWVWGT